MSVLSNYECTDSTEALVVRTHEKCPAARQQRPANEVSGRVQRVITARNQMRTAVTKSLSMRRNET